MRNNKGSTWVSTLFLLMTVMIITSRAFMTIDLANKQIYAEKNTEHIYALSESLGKTKAKEIILAFNEAQSQAALKIKKEDKIKLEACREDLFNVLVSAKAYIQIVESYFERSSERPYLYMSEQIPFKIRVQMDREKREQITYLESRLYTSDILDAFDSTLNDFTSYAQIKSLVKKIEQAMNGSIDVTLMREWFDRLKVQLMNKDVYRVTIKSETRDSDLNIYDRQRLEIVLRVEEKDDTRYELDSEDTIYFIPAYSLVVDTFKTIPVP